MATILLTMLMVGLFFVLMAVRLILIKDGEFKGTCATQNPFLKKEGIKCACGKEPGTCETDDLSSDTFNKAMASR